MKIQIKNRFNKILPEGYEDETGFHSGKPLLPEQDETPFREDMRRNEQRQFSASVFIGCVIGFWLTVVAVLIWRLAQ